MKTKLTKAQKVIVDFLIEQEGEGMIVSGYRWTERGTLNGTPVLCTFSQCLGTLTGRKLILPVEGKRHFYRLCDSLRPGDS